jgi:mRNA interferase RelE/StbE
MSWSVIYSIQAAAVLRKLPANLSRRIVSKVEALAESPYAPNNNVKALKGQGRSYRLRIGDWRVIYTLQDNELVILVIKVGPRGEIYD